MNRRQFLAAGAVAALARGPARGDDAPRSTMGIVEHSYMQRIAIERRAGGKSLADDPAGFLEFCRARGAGGVQMSLGTGDYSSGAALRARADDARMFVENSIRVPVNPTHVEALQRTINYSRAAGAAVLRTVLLPGRRYEQFASKSAFAAAVERGRKSLALAKRVIDEYRGEVRLAIENHKDWRAADLAALLEQLDSPHIGVCLDTGNSIALLEDPMETVEQLAPWAFTTHLKDMAVEDDDDGFLLAEVPLGQGFLDLPRIVAAVRKARPEIRFNLEMITRDPLKVPCLTERYWATFDGPMAWPLARMLKTVRARAAQKALPRVSVLCDHERMKVEDDNVRESLRYAREKLGLTA